MRVDNELVRRAHGTPCLAVVQARGHKLKRSGAEWIGPCPRCGGTDRFSINVRKNIWHCRQCAAGGDAISLVQHVDGIDFRAAVEAITGMASDRPSWKPPRQKAPRSRSDGSGLRIWREAIDPRGTIVEQYLDSRGLTFDPNLAGRVLRFNANCPFKLKDDLVIHLPATIALFTGITDNIARAIHRTAIKPDGSGKAEMPDSTSPKKMLGPTKDCCIKIDANETVLEGLGIGEGLETCLSVRVRGWRPIWCLGSAGAIANFPVLSGVEALTIFADHDESGVGLRAAQVCARQWRAVGREARILMPDVPGDWNDIR